MRSGRSASSAAAGTAVFVSSLAAWSSNAWFLTRGFENRRFCEEVEVSGGWLEGPWTERESCESSWATSKVTDFVASQLCRVTGGREPTNSIPCGKLTGAHGQQLAKGMPIVLRLQSWVARSTVDRLPPPAHNLLVMTFERSSPYVLLSIWIILAVAVTAYYQIYSDCRQRRLYIVWSVLMACIVGALEGSAVVTTILVDIPCCLTIGMLLHLILHCAVREQGSDKRQNLDLPYGSRFPQVIREMAGNDNPRRPQGVEQGSNGHDRDREVAFSLAT